MARPKKNVPTEATVIPEEPKNTTLTEEVPVKESIPEETAETAPTESAAPVKSAEENPSAEPEEDPECSVGDRSPFISSRSQA